MNKVREVKRGSVEICRNCQGSGTVVGNAGGDSVQQCPVCLGSGRVKRMLNITITIVPYTSEDK